MIKFLNDIRNAENSISNHRKIINTIAILFLGIALGTFSNYIAGFFPRSYAMIWFGFTVISPLLAFVC